MIEGAYRLFHAVADQPVQAWEAIRDRTVDPKERQHMDIAIQARRKLEAAPPP